MPYKEMAQIAKENGAVLLLDASQGAGSINIDVDNLGIDMMAFPGHKGLLGPQGTGGLYVNDKIKIKPLMQGGTGSNSENLFQPEVMPDMLESGTLNTPGIVGLGAGIKFIQNTGIENIRQKKHLLINRLYQGLNEMSKIQIYSKNDIDNNSGIIAFNIKGIDSTEVSYKLDKSYNVASRAGLHCSPLAHNTLRTTKSGVVRLSVGYFNTIEDVDIVLNAMREIYYSL
jgi:selenocysteine lyase/cysteine desulfurase